MTTQVHFYSNEEFKELFKPGETILMRARRAKHCPTREVLLTAIGRARVLVSIGGVAQETAATITQYFWGKIA